MSYQYIKDWRRRTKERAIIALGGCCVCCGYKKCNSALDLHHIDEKTKEFSLSRSIISWEKLVLEIRKCVLVCCRCHREIHAGIQQVPTDAPKFNEDYTIYDYKPDVEMDDCPICMNPKLPNLKTCSTKCSNLIRSKIDWTQVDLLDLIKRFNPEEIAEQLDVSGAIVRKRLKRLGYNSNKRRRRSMKKECVK